MTMQRATAVQRPPTYPVVDMTTVTDDDLPELGEWVVEHGSELIIDADGLSVDSVVGPLRVDREGVIVVVSGTVYPHTRAEFDAAYSIEGTD